MEAARIEKEFKNLVIKIDEQGIRRLYDEVTNQLAQNTNNNPEITFIIIYSDRSSIETRDLEEIVKDENKDGRKMKELQIQGENANKKIDLQIGKLTGKNYFPDIYLKIEGPDRQWVYVTQSVVEDRIKSFAENRRRSGLKAFITCASIIIGTILLTPYLKNYLPPISVPRSSGPGTDFGPGSLIIGGIDLLLCILSIYIIIKLYPDLIFLFGKELERNQVRLTSRSNLFWVIIIGIPAAIFIAIILRIFGL